MYNNTIQNVVDLQPTDLRPTEFTIIGENRRFQQLRAYEAKIYMYFDKQWHLSMRGLFES